MPKKRPRRKKQASQPKLITPTHADLTANVQAVCKQLEKLGFSGVVLTGMRRLNPAESAANSGVTELPYWYYHRFTPVTAGGIAQWCADDIATSLRRAVQQQAGVATPEAPAQETPESESPASPEPEPEPEPKD